MKYLVLNAEQLIKNANDNIERNIDVLCPDNIGLCAQNILGQLRNLVDAFALLLWYKENQFNESVNGRERIAKANKYMKGQRNNYPAFCDTHEYLERIASHFTQDQFESEVLLHKYEDLLSDLRVEAKSKFGKDILRNLDSFPFKQNDYLKEYYHSVFAKMSEQTFNSGGRINTFYVDRRKKRHGYFDEYIYEYILTPAKDRISKFDRLTAFSLKPINNSHAIRCTIYSDTISISGINTRIYFIGDYQVSIRPCEIREFAYLEGLSMSPLKRDSAGYKPLMSFLTEQKCSLFDLIMSDNFDESIKLIQGDDRDNRIYEFLKYTNSYLHKQEEGFKTLIYLLYVFKNDIMKNQECDLFGETLAKTNLNYGCRHFECLPFGLSLLKHNPKNEDLVECLLDYCSQDQLLKRRIVINTENNKTLFTPISELDKYYLTDELIELFNSRLDDSVKSAALLKTPDGKYVYSKSYVDDTRFIMQYIVSKASKKDFSYQSRAIEYLKANPHLDIDDDKKIIIKTNFSNGSVILINGAAGTGKTTLIKHLSNLLLPEKVLFLSCTNTSVQNLRRKVGINDYRLSAQYMTIESFLRTKDIHAFDSYNVVIIDECSTVSNRDFKQIIRKKDFDKLVLVGDEKQIESIKFGNWFGIANAKYKAISHELLDTHRTTNSNIRKLWDDTRNYAIDVETFVSADCVKEIDNEIFERTSDDKDEIILCLTYDGLYGINNINRYMQELNHNRLVSWNVWSFKKGDRILFNENYYFRDYFHNNQKGLIEEINESESDIVFDLRIDSEEGNNRLSGRYVKYLSGDERYDHYRIRINKKDDDDEENESTIIPFQLGYAISIHKSQGLEYDSVKVVITKEVEESISHNIFYTAITRCKKELRIYTDKSSLQKVIDGFIKPNYENDSSILDSLE